MTYYVFVPTPMYRDSNHIAHLIEHCLLHHTNSNEAAFFAAFSQMDAYTYGCYAQYECSTEHALNALLHSMDTDITASTLSFELERVKEELASPSFNKQLYTAICKKLYDR